MTRNAALQAKWLTYCGTTIKHESNYAELPVPLVSKWQRCMLHFRMSPEPSTKATIPLAYLPTADMTAFEQPFEIYCGVTWQINFLHTFLTNVPKNNNNKKRSVFSKASFSPLLFGCSFTPVRPYCIFSAVLPLQILTVQWLHWKRKHVSHWRKVTSHLLVGLVCRATGSWQHDISV